MTFLRALASASFLVVTLSSCVVEDRGYSRPAPCRGAVWVEGHYGPRGAWHPGHWRCPGVVEVVEVD
jgi:hypothetical protein